MMHNLKNLEAEQALLGGLMLSSVIQTSMLGGLDSHHFSAPLHAKIYDVIKRYERNGLIATPVIIQSEFGDEMEDKAYLARLAGSAASVVNLKDYASVIIDLAHKRELTDVAASILEASPETPLTGLCAEMARAVQLVSEASTSKRITSSRKVAIEVVEDMKHAIAPDSTGIPKLDEAMGGGLYAGKAYGFAARKKVGKTVIAGTIAYNLNLAGAKHLFVCCEMGQKEIEQRTLARRAEVYPSGFRIGNTKPRGFDLAVADAANTMPENTLYYDAPGITLDQLKMVVANAVSRHQIKGFILDYWQLVEGKEKGDSEAAHLGRVAQWIANACKQYNIWALVLAQINQEGNTRGGEGIRLAFDQVYHLHREDTSQPDAWLEMMDTRYTAWANIGSKERAGLLLNDKGPFFVQAGEYSFA